MSSTKEQARLREGNYSESGLRAMERALAKRVDEYFATHGHGYTPGDVEWKAIEEEANRISYIRNNFGHEYRDMPEEALFKGAVWLTILDGDGYEGSPDYIIQLVLRPMLSNEPRKVERFDQQFDYISGQDRLVEVCANPKRWERINLRGILDLRARPQRVEIIGRKYAPYFTEYDVVMRMVQ